MNDPAIVALIPAREGSRRIPAKNIRPLAGRPLLAYAIQSARDAGIFTEIICSTDDARIATIAQYYGATHLHMRSHYTNETDPDIAWVTPALIDCSLRHYRDRPEAFAILRPTAPFRSAEDIRQAWAAFKRQQPCQSLRAVRPVREHPGKMWIVRSLHTPAPPDANPAIGSACEWQRMTPLLPWDTDGIPWHSRPTQVLPQVYVQDASLEIAWWYCVLPPALAVSGTWDSDGTISGYDVMPFMLPAHDGFDLNTPSDWAEAERLLEVGETTLSVIDRPPYVERNDQSSTE